MSGKITQQESEYAHKQQQKRYRFVGPMKKLNKFLPHVGAKQRRKAFLKAQTNAASV